MAKRNNHYWRNENGVDHCTRCSCTRVVSKAKGPTYTLDGKTTKRAPNCVERKDVQAEVKEVTSTVVDSQWQPVVDEGFAILNYMCKNPLSTKEECGQMSKFIRLLCDTIAKT